MKPRSKNAHRQWCGVIVVAVALGLTAMGCSKLKTVAQGDVVFPRLDSVREQFYYAKKVEDTTLIGRTSEKRDTRLMQVIAAHQMVLDHFPDDQIYAPLALASIGNCYFKMQDYRRAIRIFKSIEKRYPNYPFVHAEAEWKIGRSEELLGNSREAKRHYKLCIDTFRHSKNDQIKTIVALCQQYYLPPSIPGKPKR